MHNAEIDPALRSKNFVRRIMRLHLKYSHIAPPNLRESRAATSPKRGNNFPLSLGAACLCGRAGVRASVTLTDFGRCHLPSAICHDARLLAIGYRLSAISHHALLLRSLRSLWLNKLVCGSAALRCCRSSALRLNNLVTISRRPRNEPQLSTINYQLSSPVQP